MTDTTLSLAARLAANLIVDAINLAKPGARLAGKIGDRALNRIGGPAFNERVAQRFLLDGADALNEMEERVDVLEPGWSAAPRLLADDPAFGLAPHGFNAMPNWQAPKSSAPVAPKPTDVAGSPGSASAPPLPGVDPGHLARFAAADWLEATLGATGIECGAGWVLWLVDGVTERLARSGQPVGAGVVAPGTGEADLICRVMSQHWFHVDSCDKPFEYSYSCRSPMGEPCETFPIRGYPGAIEAWQSHVAPLILAALNAQK